jgi:hypothetical protein
MNIFLCGGECAEDIQDHYKAFVAPKRSFVAPKRAFGVSPQTIFILCITYQIL